MNKDNLLFSEIQRFRQWWLWLIFIGLNGFMLFLFLQQLISGQPIGDKPMSTAGLLILFLLTLMLTSAFTMFKLETQIREDGIYVRFYPIHVRFKHYDWHTIRKLYIRQYQPIAEYGGWGMRGIKNQALNIAGNMGLQLELQKNEKLLIGTQKTKVLHSALTHILHVHPHLAQTAITELPDIDRSSQ